MDVTLPGRATSPWAGDPPPAAGGGNGRAAARSAAERRGAPPRRGGPLGPFSSTSFSHPHAGASKLMAIPGPQLAQKSLKIGLSPDIFSACGALMEDALRAITDARYLPSARASPSAA